MINATFSTNKTDSHDIIEILLKVALNTKTLTRLFSDLYQVGGYIWRIRLSSSIKPSATI
jgi:hypothetical protein